MTDGIRKKLKVPNLLGLSVRDAAVVLHAHGFGAPDVSYSESYQPRLSVISQAPPRGQIVDGEEVVKLTVSQRNLIRFLPHIFQKDGADGSNFLRDYLWIPQHLMESIESQLSQIHTYFDPYETPAEFLPWLASWVAFVLDENWPEDKKRYIIKRAVELYRIRGTVKGMKVFLNLFIGVEPDIIENEWPFEGFRIGVSSTIGVDSIILPPVNRSHCFVVDFPIHPDEVDDNLIIRIHDIIRSQKPAHTTYFLRFMGQRRQLSTFGIVIGEHAVGSGLEIADVGESEADEQGAADIGWGA